LELKTILLEQQAEADRARKNSICREKAAEFIELLKSQSVPLNLSVIFLSCNKSWNKTAVANIVLTAFIVFVGSRLISRCPFSQRNKSSTAHLFL